MKIRVLLKVGVVAVVLHLLACDTSSPMQSWPLVEQCDLQQGLCRGVQDKQQVTLLISPRPLPIAKPLDVQVGLAGFDQVDKVELDIAGVNMYMGYNRVELKPQGEGVYSGVSMLAFCTNQEMQWQISVLIHQGENVTAVPFSTTTRR